MTLPALHLPVVTDGNERRHCDNAHERTAPHVCPYQSDVNGDEETLCTCCEACQYECAMDI